MTVYNQDDAFISALKKLPKLRKPKDLQIIYSRLQRLETLATMKEQRLKTLCSVVRYECHNSNETLYTKDDRTNCWYILLSGSVFIQGSMFLPHASFGKQIPGTLRRGCQCLVLEPSEMIAIDYPDIVIQSRQHASSTGSRSTISTLGSVIEADSSSAENSPKHGGRHSLGRRVGNGHIMTSQSSIDSNKVQQNYGQASQDQESTASNQDDMDQDDISDDEEHEDSISLHSESSLVIRDLVTEVLKKDLQERDTDDHDTLLEFTKSLQAFSNMTEPIRRSLCKYMLYAWVEKRDTIVLKDKEQLDSWSVVINGKVQVTQADGSTKELGMGDSFGVSPSLETQYHKGEMITLTNDCQFLCIAQSEYFEVLTQGEENREIVKDIHGEITMVKEKRELEGGARSGNIVIQGTPDSLLQQLLEENAIDTTYTEDYLLTYRAFHNDPLLICRKLLGWFDDPKFQDKVTRVILLWVNNHFNDFEANRKMMELLEQFEEKLKRENKSGQIKLFNIACSTKAKSKTVNLKRGSSTEPLDFDVIGGSKGIYISNVKENTDAYKQGLKRGDQLLTVNGQNFEKLSLENGKAILCKNTDLTIAFKTNLFSFKEITTELENPTKEKKSKKGNKSAPQLANQSYTMADTRMASLDIPEGGKHRKGGTFGRAFRKVFKKDQSYTDYIKTHGDTMSSDELATLPNSKDDSYMSRKHSLNPGMFATMDGLRSFSQSLSTSNPDLFNQGLLDDDTALSAEVPEDVIKVFRSDQTYRFIFINRDTTAEEAVKKSCKEFGIIHDCQNYSLCKVTVQGEKFVKQSKLPDKLSKLTDIPLSARYYLKNNMDSEQLLPDENIPELLKEGNYTFLDLNSFEVALHLTTRDYLLFKRVEQTDFIDDLFKRQSEGLKNFSEFEELVNQELFWVVSTICSEPNVLRRAKMIKHFTKIAHHCKVLKNLNSTFAIISGLGYRAVSRLKSTWEKAPAKSVRMFEELQSLMDPSRNMSKYRTLLNEQISQPPVIPYVPVVKKDLTFLDLGNDTRVNGLINFEKMRMIGREVRNICRLCNPDAAQILSSAVAQQETENKPTSSIYQTLTRRGRRSSFNNARRMYEDAVNTRRVKQFMEQLTIETDEEKLMEMSKQVESQQAPSSAQTRRRNTAATTESPSKGAKTQQNNAKTTTHLRNNSEPQITVGGATTPVKKKTPSSSFPKFGVTSPQAISKLMSLSEESCDKKESKPSKERSPAASPAMRHKGPASSLESLHNIGQENSNKNNNRNSLPCSHQTFVSFNKVARGKDDLGVMKRGDGGMIPHYSGKNPHNRYKNNHRSNSSSGFEGFRAAHRGSDQPVIMQNRSSSFGSGNLAAQHDQKLSNSSSSPSLVMKTHHNAANLLPNVPNILRAPSMDSGVVEISDCDAPETENLKIAKSKAGSHSSLSSGFASSTSLASGFDPPPDMGHYKPSPAVAASHRSPQLHRHYNVHMRDNVRAGKPTENSTQSHETNDSKKRKSVEQTFLSGSRGLGDSPQTIYKDSWPVVERGVPRSRQEPATDDFSHAVNKEANRSLQNSVHNEASKNNNIQLYYQKISSQERPPPPKSLDFSPSGRSPHKSPHVRMHDKTPEDMLEEKLITDLRNQKINKTANMVMDERNNSHFFPSSPLCEKHSNSLSHFQYPDPRHPQMKNIYYVDKLPPPDRTSSPKLPPDNVFATDFNSSPAHRLAYNKMPQYPVCPRHAHMSPYVTHSVAGVKNSSHIKHDTRSNTSFDGSVNAIKVVDNKNLHSRSASDISINSKEFEKQYRQYIPPDPKMVPSPISPFHLPNESFDSNHSDTPHAHSRKSNHIIRRKSGAGEWGVTDLDNDKSQQAMQVWSGNNSSTTSNSTASVSLHDDKGTPTSMLNSSYATRESTPSVLKSDSFTKDSTPKRISYSPSYHTGSQNSIFFAASTRPLSQTQHHFSQGDLSSSRHSLPSYDEATSNNNHTSLYGAGDNSKQEQLTSIV